jgi:diguanylate cyclase (GGDEF)-like protein
MVVLIVILIVLALGAILAYAFKLLRIEKVPAEPEVLPIPEEAEAEEAAEEEPEELVNLVEYFSDKPEEEKEPYVVRIPTDEHSIDPLTGYPIGRAFLSECMTRLAEAKENGESYALAWFDVDRFRFINSIRGLSLGDYVLSHLAEDIRAIFPPYSVYSRVSADHFAVLFLLPDDSIYHMYGEEIRGICERIRADIAIKSAIHICLGIAEAKPSGGKYAYDIAVLMKKARLACHCLKGSKTESVAVYDDSMVTSLLYGQSALEDYSESQYGDDFGILYQPVTDLARNRIAGCNVLARWNCQESSLTILDAENGRLPTNNDKVFYHACRAASRWRKAGKDVPPIYIYVPETEFFKGDLDDFQSRCLSEFQLEAAAIHITIDAAIVRLDWATTDMLIRRLRESGMRVGVGGIDASVKSLDFLGGLPISYIKLDKSFAFDITENPDRANDVRAMISMVGALNMRAIFEGVNTVEQASELRNLGVTYTEGRFSGSPLNGDDLARLLNNSTRGRDGTLILSDGEASKGEYHI